MLEDLLATFAFSILQDLKANQATIIFEAVSPDEFGLQNPVKDFLRVIEWRHGVSVDHHSGRNLALSLVFRKQ